MHREIEDAHSRGLIGFGKEDFIAKAIRNPHNHSRIDLALAKSVVDISLWRDAWGWYLTWWPQRN